MKRRTTTSKSEALTILTELIHQVYWDEPEVEKALRAVRAYIRNMPANPKP